MLCLLLAQPFRLSSDVRDASYRDTYVLPKTETCSSPFAIVSLQQSNRGKRD
jgi:hypothetical protein